MTMAVLKTGSKREDGRPFGKARSWHPRFTPPELRIAQNWILFSTITKKANHHLAVDILPES